MKVMVINGSEPLYGFLCSFQHVITLIQFQLFPLYKPGSIKSSPSFPIDFQLACLFPVAESLHRLHLFICWLSFFLSLSSLCSFCHYYSCWPLITCPLCNYFADSVFLLPRNLHRCFCFGVFNAAMSAGPKKTICIAFQKCSHLKLMLSVALNS